MKKLLFISLIFPIISQELIVNSFDNQSNYDDTYWQLDMSGASGLGYANCSSSNISHDNNGAVKIEYNVQNEESWGGFTKLSHFHPDPESVYDFSDFNVISFWYYNELPASEIDRMDLRFVLYDVSTSPNNDVYSESQVEYFYSFHFDMLDMAPGWNKVEIPLTGTNIPDQSLPYTFGFNNTGWNGIPGDNNFDLDSIKGFALEFFVNNPSGTAGDSVQGTIILDELKAENTEIAEPEEVTVTFQVDMSNENINPACPPSLAGSWNGWQWTETLEEGQDNIWSTDITLNSDVTYEYKFGNCGWSLEDLEPGSECTNTTGIYTNRFIQTSNQDTVLSPVCYGGCEQECEQPDLVLVTFQVDTNNNPNGYDDQLDMFLIGSFQTPFAWDIDLFPINLEDPNDDGIWNTTISILSGTYIEYKFTNGEGGDALIENNIENCSNDDGNRYLTVPYQDITLEATYFNSCNSEGNVTVTFQVDMSNQEIGGGDGACGVHIGGSFNYFDWWVDELSDDNDDDIWKTDIILEIGDFIEYKFANCGSFGIETVPDDCGYGEDLNRSFTVPSQDTIISPVCFETCSQECGDISYSTVTFSVDMNNEETSETGVFVSGPGALMGPSGVQLYDNDNDDIWTGTISVPYGEYYYKFRNGYYTEWDADGWEELSGNCAYGEFNDRRLIVDEPTICQDIVNFGTCETYENSFCAECGSGDANQDNLTDVLDVVVIITSIINQAGFSNIEICHADINSDGLVNVLDVVVIVNSIISS